MGLTWQNWNAIQMRTRIRPGKVSNITFLKRNILVIPQIADMKLRSMVKEKFKKYTFAKFDQVK